MAGLHEVVQGLAGREGVDAVVVLSGDGLPIDHATRGTIDADAVSALAATLAQGARRLGRAAECDELTAGVLEFGGRLAVFSALPDENLLFLVLAPGANAGELLHDLRRHGPAFADLL
jgi:predicted regulator of Ras-like GTPase activity (Roadblock/LC7/MglB family)